MGPLRGYGTLFASWVPDTFKIWGLKVLAAAELARVVVSYGACNF